MARAKRQAEQYVRALPVAEGRPPFIIVADVGHCFDIYAEFSCTGGIYIPFPDQGSRRIPLAAGRGDKGGISSSSGSPRPLRERLG